MLNSKTRNNTESKEKEGRQRKDGLFQESKEKFGADCLDMSPDIHKEDLQKVLDAYLLTEINYLDSNIKAIENKMTEQSYSTSGQRKQKALNLFKFWTSHI